MFSLYQDWRTSSPPSWGPPLPASCCLLFHWISSSSSIRVCCFLSRPRVFWCCSDKSCKQTSSHMLNTAETYEYCGWLWKYVQMLLNYSVWLDNQLKEGSWLFQTSSHWGNTYSFRNSFILMFLSVHLFWTIRPNTVQSCAVQSSSRHLNKH